MGITQYTSFLEQQLEVMMNFRKLIRLKKEKLGLQTNNDKTDAIESSNAGSLEQATKDMKGLKLFEYYVEVQINAIECGKSLTEEFKEEIEKMEAEAKKEKEAKAKEEKELHEAEKAKEKAQKAFEKAKAKIEQENLTKGESLIDISDEELMAETVAKEEAKAKHNKSSAKKSKTADNKEKAKEEEPASLFDLFGEE